MWVFVEIMLLLLLPISELFLKKALVASVVVLPLASTQGLACEHSFTGTEMGRAERPIAFLAVSLFVFSAINFTLGYNLLGERGRQNKVCAA